MFRNQCLTGGTEHGGIGFPGGWAFHAPNLPHHPRRGTAKAQRVRKDGGGMEGRKGPHRAILEDISSGLVLSFLIGRRFLDHGYGVRRPSRYLQDSNSWFGAKRKDLSWPSGFPAPSSAARPSSKLGEDSRARASEGLSAASRRVGESAILGVLWLFSTLLVGESGTATQLQLQVQTGEGQGASGYLLYCQARPGLVRSGRQGHRLQLADGTGGACRGTSARLARLGSTQVSICTKSRSEQERARASMPNGGSDSTRKHARQAHASLTQAFRLSVSPLGARATDCSTQPWEANFPTARSCASHPKCCIAELRYGSVRRTRESWWRAGAAALSLQVTACGLATEVNHYWGFPLLGAPLLHQEEHGSQDGGVVAYVACKCEVQRTGSIVSTDSTPSTRRHPPRRLACATLCPERPRPRMAPGSDRSSFGLSPCSRVITPYPVQYCVLVLRTAYVVRTASKQSGARGLPFDRQQHAELSLLAPHSPMKDEFPPPWTQKNRWCSHASTHSSTLSTTLSTTHAFQWLLAQPWH